MSVLALLVASAPTGAAEQLAGSKGDSRFPVYFAPGTVGGCGKHYKGYVAAGGHSAYAMTPFNWATEFTICGAYLNAPSQKAAEALALKSCQSARSKYKVTTAGACAIAASK
ncbi:hypothetical protein NMG46_23925 [Mesorhizobium sp. LMG 17147]|uniref:hypothetical protein n=1 Tax=Mesorhizobium sp. LMG 17147 TaxID=2963091 RepID=UPI0020C949A8|nr:hypothetical protein [Mesorhizobium sp. LMG 17147]MCP9233254.1 hypothetical protein [Mesorhizobium sp. LMG 17147]